MKSFIQEEAVDCLDEKKLKAIDKRDLYEERAAIYEFEAGMSKVDAEKQAWHDVYVNPS